MPDEPNLDTSEAEQFLSSEPWNDGPVAGEGEDAPEFVDDEEEPQGDPAKAESEDKPEEEGEETTEGDDEGTETDEADGEEETDDTADDGAALVAEQLQEAGLPDDSIPAMVERQNAEFGRLKTALASIDINLEGKDLNEITQELEQAILNYDDSADAKKGDEKGDEAPPDIDLSSFYKQFDLDDTQRKFYGDGFKAVAGQFKKDVGDLSKQIKAEMNARLGTAEVTTSLLHAQMWYNAVAAENAKNGDEPMPSFQEAYNRMVRNPEAVNMAVKRLIRFKDSTANPMRDVVAQWRSERTPSGERRGASARHAKEAEKINRKKAESKPTAKRKSGGRDPFTGDNRSTAEIANELAKEKL